MKWITLTFGFISLVTACVVNEQTLSCPTKTIDNIVANVRSYFSKTFLINH